MQRAQNNARPLQTLRLVISHHRNTVVIARILNRMLLEIIDKTDKGATHTEISTYTFVCRSLYLKCRAIIVCRCCRVDSLNKVSKIQLHNKSLDSSTNTLVADSLSDICNATDNMQIREPILTFGFRFDILQSVGYKFRYRATHLNAICNNGFGEFIISLGCKRYHSVDKRWHIVCIIFIICIIIKTSVIGNSSLF